MLAPSCCCQSFLTLGVRLGVVASAFQTIWVVVRLHPKLADEVEQVFLHGTSATVALLLRANRTNKKCVPLT